MRNITMQNIHKNTHIVIQKMTRILKLGLLTWMKKTNGLAGLTLSNKMDLMYNILSNSYDDQKDALHEKSKEKKKDPCNQKSGKAIQRIA
jgi:hypothetical protein